MHLLHATALSLLTSAASAADLPDVLSGRGIWWDNASELAMLSRLDDASIRRVHIMLTHAPAAGTCANPAKAEVIGDVKSQLALAKKLSDRSKVVISTVYLPPTKDAVNSLFDPKEGPVRAMAKQGIVSAFELDLEGGWKKHPPCGYKSHVEAFDDFKARANALGFEVGITTHASHLNDPKIPLPKAAFVSLQAYSKCTAEECKAFDDRKYGPGNRQKASFARLKGYGGPVILGLAAYGQLWEGTGHTREEAMTLALSAVKALQVQHPKLYGYSYWSVKFVDGGKDNIPSAYDFLRDNKEK